MTQPNEVQQTITEIGEKAQKGITEESLSDGLQIARQLGQIEVSCERIAKAMKPEIFPSDERAKETQNAFAARLDIVLRRAKQFDSYGTYRAAVAEAHEEIVRLGVLAQKALTPDTKQFLLKPAQFELWLKDIKTDPLLVMIDIRRKTEQDRNAAQAGSATLPVQIDGARVVGHGLRATLKRALHELGD